MSNLRRIARDAWLGLMVITLAACGAQQRPGGGSGLLPVGSPAPEVIGRDPQGRSVRLSERRGHPSVVYFYPKDDTPGCTKEACAFRDTFARFMQHGVMVFGVSRDSAASHGKFRTKYELPFPLVSDEAGTLQTAYGVPSHFGMAARVSFLIDGQGRVARVWPDVDPTLHAAQVLAAAEALGRVETH